MKFAVIGAGSWGTTLANLLSNNGHHVMLWAREPEVVAGINTDRHKPYFVSHLEINQSLVCTNNMDEAIKYIASRKITWYFVDEQGDALGIPKL